MKILQILAICLLVFVTEFAIADTLTPAVTGSQEISSADGAPAFDGYVLQLRLQKEKDKPKPEPKPEPKPAPEPKDTCGSGCGGGKDKDKTDA